MGWYKGNTIMPRIKFLRPLGEDEIFHIPLEGEEGNNVVSQLLTIFEGEERIQLLDYELLDQDIVSILSERGLEPRDAGDVLISSAPTERSTQNLSGKLEKEIHIARTGDLRIKFDLKISGNDPGDEVYGVIKRYRDGNETTVGTQRNTTSLNYVTFSEDIEDWEPGDLCRLYHWREATGYSWVQNFNLYSTSGFVDIILLD